MNVPPHMLPPRRSSGSGLKVAVVVLGVIAVSAATINVVGGFMITDRMLKMFKSKKAPAASKSASKG